jgi:hypothetical protein
MKKGKVEDDDDEDVEDDDDDDDFEDQKERRDPDWRTRGAIYRVSFGKLGD